MSVYGELVARHGLSEAHARLLAAVPPGARVLDAGCATGYLVAVLAERGHDVVGFERDAEAAAIARARGLEVVTGDIEVAEDLATLPGPFDAVLLGDVLEHLRDPGAVLRAVKPLLATGGVVVASVPNAVHWTARRQVLRGRFPQEDHGLFDRTHLHFFTRATMRELAREAGYDVLAEEPVPAPLPLEAHVRLPARLRQAAASQRPGLFALQFVLTLHPRA